ncbi:uncharacterized protein LOC128988036 [Macrosteles quadrilineatus]|uniref:uncharacterized protein LOC128988036 n=1 Tax=Macrosteles quadrilineatus TaxID=74068 RepID=UPI0023E1D65E|nr:uncharacterized protein LOC128988036 [Macrosteles quadrilineatus]
MKVCRNNLTDLVSVIYHPTHSHVCSPQDYLHHPLPQDLSSFINCQLGEEVSPSKIFNKVKNINIDKSRDVQTQKVNILTKKRIRERARRQRMAQRLHEDDAKSVYLMASEMVSKENSVVIYKPYGADVVYGPEDVNNLPYSMEIFMFGFQTPRQLQLMKDHCNKILIVDETHGTNQYSYKLLTCMVVDDNRRGWPVAHLVTNKSDAATLKFFFKGLSERIEDPSRINCVITDDDSAIINGIEAGFSSPMRHLLCRWHVIKNLKDNVRTKVPKDLFEDVFSEIRVLMNIEDLNMFEDLCEGFLKKYEEKDKTAKFITYFRQHYLNRTEKWAMCHRNFPHAQVNTTGHVESFHNKFKKMYLKRRVNKRLDDLITMLRNLEWEDHCNRQREALVGFSPIPQHIGERHQKSLAIPDEALVEILANTWEIKSQTKESEVYVIVCYSNTCYEDYCFVKCTQVQCDGLCSHLYTCTCPDQHSLCKHIHKLHSYLRRGKAFSTTFCSFEESLQPIEDQADLDKRSTTENMAARKSSSLLAKIEQNLSTLSQFQMSAIDNKVSEQTLRHVNYTLTNLVNHIQMSDGKSQLVNVNEMKAAVKFNSQEKLKTQVSQLLSFKRPVSKRKRKPADCKEKKETVIKNLLDFLP